MHSIVMRPPIHKFLQEHPELLEGSKWQALSYSIDLFSPRNENARFIAHSRACQVVHIEGEQKVSGW
jgi:hypothetical protein